MTAMAMHMSVNQKLIVDEQTGQIIVEETFSDARERLLDRISRTIVETRDELIQEGLKKLGWTPPDEPPFGSRWTHEQLEKAYNELATKYEDLRKAIDNGHESMTHDDAVAWVRQAHQNNFRLSKLEW